MDFYKEKYLKYKKKYLNLKNLEGGKEERKQFFLGLKKEEDYEDLPILLNKYLNSEYFKNLNSDKAITIDKAIDKAIEIDIGEYKKVPNSVTKIMLDNIEKLKEESKEKLKEESKEKLKEESKEKLELPYLENLYSKLLEIFEKNNIEKTVNYFCQSNNTKTCKENIRKNINAYKDDSENFAKNLDQNKLEELLNFFKVGEDIRTGENLESYMWRLHGYANKLNEEKFNINDWNSINESPRIKNFIGLLISKYNENKKNQPETRNSYDISKVTKLPDSQTPKFPNSG